MKPESSIDRGILVIAVIVTVGAFAGLFLGKITFEQFLLATNPALIFYFGRANGRTSAYKEMNGSGGQ